MTYVRAGQRFWGVDHAHGGWFVGSAALKTALVASGLPASPPVSDGGSSFPSAWTGAAAFVVLLLLLALRRRGTTRLPAPRSTA